MSFILDALKKSETDRQRQNGPALFEVRVAPPRNGLPVWAMGLAALLAVNLLIVGWVLLRRPAAAEAATAAPPAAGQSAGGGSGGSYPGGGSVQAASGYSGGGQAPGNQPYPGAGSGSGQQYAGGAGPGSNQRYPGATSGSGQPYSGAGAGANQPYPDAPSGSAQGYQGQGTAPGLGVPAGPQGAQQGQGSAQGPGTVPVAGTAPTSPVTQTAGMTQPPPAYPGNSAGGQSDGSTGHLNPDDYAPATDAPAPAGFGNHVSRSTSSGVPLYQDVALTPGVHIPELRLDLHVFAAKPQERFVMINMQKLHEGDNLREGVHVESITPEGAVLSSNGTRFLLPRD
jgi:general secretion pathway protein B